MEKVLPYDVVLQVFCRLPIQSIFNCKLVCKAWLGILKDPFFALQHVIYRQLINGGDHYAYDHGFLMLIIDFSIFSGFSLWYHDYVKTNEEEVGLYMPPIKRISHPTIRRYDHYCYKSIIGSCNGLICCSLSIDGDPIYICNPVTKEYLCLPKLMDSQEYESGGFGYHHSTNEYKVVRILSRRSTSVKRQVQVYTLGGTSDHGWRNKDDIRYVFSRRGGIFVNGEIYWLSYDSTIVAFNIADEKFHEVISLPPSITDDFGLPLFEVDGCLCVVEYLRDDKKNDVWLLRKRTGNDLSGKEFHTLSWRKEFSISTSMFIFPLSITKGGGLLIWQDGECLCYDPKHGIAQHIGHSNNEYIFEVIPHTNSLVSLKALVDERPDRIRRE